MKSFHQIVERFKDNIVVKMEPENVTVEGKIAELRHLLSVTKEIMFSSFLETPISSPEDGLQAWHSYPSRVSW